MPYAAPAAAGVDAGETRTLHALVLDDHPHPAGPVPRRRGLFVDAALSLYAMDVTRRNWLRREASGTF